MSTYCGSIENNCSKLRRYYFVCVGFYPSCPHSRLPILPLCRHSDNLPVLREKDDGSAEEEKKNEEEEGGLQEERKKEERSLVSQPQQQQRFLSTARGLFQGNASTPSSTPGLGGSNLSTTINRRRLFSLEPFHQSSIISSRLKREREEEREGEREEEDRTGNLNKKTKLTNGKRSPGWCFYHTFYFITSLLSLFEEAVIYISGAFK